MIPDGLSYRLSEESFTTFPEALINSDDERLSTPNTLFITFIICFLDIEMQIMCPLGLRYPLV